MDYSFSFFNLIILYSLYSRATFIACLVFSFLHGKKKKILIIRLVFDLAKKYSNFFFQDIENKGIALETLGKKY